MSEQTPKKKIIVDEDWKSQVDAERAELEEQRVSKSTTDASQAESPQMPPASFEMLLTTLATEAMVALGQIPHPMNEKRTVNIEQAKYFVDTLAMIQEKTKGNLSTEEQTVLDGLLHQLQMAFINAKNAPAAATEKPID